MPELKDLKPYDLDGAMRRLAALELEVSAGNGGGVAKAMIRQLRREIAVAEEGQHPSIAARPSQVPAVKAAARIGRSADEPVDGAEPDAPQGQVPAAGASPGPNAADFEAAVEAEVQRRMRASQTAGRIKLKGKGKKGKRRAKPKPASPDAAQTV